MIYMHNIQKQYHLLIVLSIHKNANSNKSLENSKIII